MILDLKVLLQSKDNHFYLLLHQEAFQFFPTAQMKLGLKEISQINGGNHQILFQFPIEEMQVKLEKIKNPNKLLLHDFLLSMF